MNTTWIPDRKLWASGLTYVVAAIIVKSIEAYTGFDVPPFLEEWAPLGLAGSVAYLVPPSVQDVLRRLNDEIVTIASRDPKTPVSPEIATTLDRAAALRGVNHL